VSQHLHGIRMKYMFMSRLRAANVNSKSLIVRGRGGACPGEGKVLTRLESWPCRMQEPAYGRQARPQNGCDWMPGCHNRSLCCKENAEKIRKADAGRYLCCHWVSVSIFLFLWCHKLALLACCTLQRSILTTMPVGRSHKVLTPPPPPRGHSRHMESLAVGFQKPKLLASSSRNLCPTS